MVKCGKIMVSILCGLDDAITVPEKYEQTFSPCNSVVTGFH